MNHFNKETSPVPSDFFVEIPNVIEKDQDLIVMIIDDIKKYSEGVFKFENILYNIKALERESASKSKNSVVSTVSWVFFKINLSKLGNKTETTILEINSLIEAVIREIGSLEPPTIQKITKIILQFPAFLSKSN